jgi:hypothetical protein
MSNRFIPCPSCARHVREGECVCPFCGAKAPCAKPLRPITERLARAAMHAAGAVGAAVALGDCSSQATHPPYGVACLPDGCVYSTEDGGADAGDASDARSSDAATDALPSDGSSDGGGAG